MIGGKTRAAAFALMSGGGVEGRDRRCGLRQKPPVRIREMTMGDNQTQII